VKILVLGSGAREHALLTALSRDPAVSGLFCAPGNAGTAALAQNRPVVVDDAAGVVALAQDVDADLVVVGPEVPLVAGVADALREAGVPCFGPSAEAARIEGSKSFAKQVMRDAGVATAEAAVFTDAGQCAAHLVQAAAPYVVKADGLAAGKGVHVGSDLAAATAFARDVLAEPGSTAVVEAYLDGPEVSLFALSDGTTVVPLLPARTSSGSATATPAPNTGGHGRVRAAAVAARRAPSSRCSARCCSRGRRAGPAAARRSAGCSTPARDDVDRAAGHRVQLPLRRSETQVVLALLETPLAGCGTRWPAAAREAARSLAHGAAVTVVVAPEGYPDPGERDP
jgi:phosphoribosylamine--glycine ligase